VTSDSAAFPSLTDGIDTPAAPQSRWPAIIGGVLTVAMMAGLARALFAHGLDGLFHAVPQNPLFYLCFALFYISVPLGDYVIFRRLWNIPPSGLIALIRKSIANEVVLGYSGEAYFYAWARQRARMVAAPFGAVKDVSILSAVAGNITTLALAVLALPFGYRALPPTLFGALAASAGVMVLTSLPFLIFSRRVFSLPRATLWWIFGVHFVRLLASTVLIALTWHFALAAVSLGMLLLLSAGRMIASRLPLVPNKDLLFANFAVLLIGQGQALANLVAVTAALTLIVHVTVFCAFGLLDLIRKQA
jgi:hypothetical protein